MAGERTLLPAGTRLIASAGPQALCAPGAPPCCLWWWEVAWCFWDLGFIDGGQAGQRRPTPITGYPPPDDCYVLGTFPAEPWSLHHGGLTVRLQFEDDMNCADHNPYTQTAEARATIGIGADTILGVDWFGRGETQDPGYEEMRLTVQQLEPVVGPALLVGRAHAPGGGLGCAPMGAVVSDPPPPHELLLTPGRWLLRLWASTNDPLYHFHADGDSGAFYEAALSFRPAEPA
ncbi:MAG: hypothetical protein GX591_20045 [Planctomycetes bacterium]|nr:hypothetical protein [Planctomycetota bacterium]